MLSPEFLGIGGGSSSYRVANSLRFRASNSAYLSRTSGASPTDQKKVTYSAWMKAAPTLSSGSQVALVCTTGNAGMIAWNISGYGGRLFTRADANDVQFAWLARDPSAWFHLVVTIDTTQATASDRIKAWLNGVALVYQSGTYPTLNSNTTLNPASTAMRLMSDIVNGTYLDGHLTHVHLIDGQALTPSSFGKTDAVTGEWVPIRYSGTYGTNGFRLAFEDATTTTTIGNDSSGNANNWTTSGISVTAGTTFDQSLDTPTLNFPVWSPIDKGTVTVSEGNTAAVPAADVHAIRATMAIPSSGKWYWEIAVSALGYGTGIGIADNVSVNTTGPSSAATRTYQFGSWFNSFNSGVVQYGTSQAITGATNWSGASQPAANDIIMVAVDMDNGSMWVGKNGTWFNSSGTANPATNTDPRWTGLTGTTWFPYMAGYTSTAVTSRVNFGQRAFAHTPPTGFSALNTANLAAPSIKRSRQYFDARLRTGTGAAASVSDLEFAPDLVWIKSRSAATTHNLFDTSRGAQKGIQSTGPNAEYTDANSLSAFASNGYSLGSDASSRGVNVSAATYVDWALKSGSAPGFNVTLYTGNGGGARNIAHGLGVAPQFALVRGRDARVWAGYHKNMTSAAYYLDLGTAAAEAVDTTMFDSTAPDASNFRVGSYNNANLVNYLAYLFTEVPGFSRIGVYTGNNNTDGPFVWCGFKPKFVMVKARDVATGWFIANPSGSANEVIQRVFSDSAGAEASNTYGLDLLAGGFKVRAPTGYSLNNSGNSYLFIAFADVPFKYSRAR
jgi:hypothetical protein